MQPSKIAALTEEAVTGRRPDLGVARLAERMADVTIDVHGSGALTLLDERGRTKQHEPFENFVAVPGLNYLKWVVRRAMSTYGTNMSGTAASSGHTLAFLGSGSDTDQYAPGHVFGSLFLSDSVAAEASSTEQYMPGTIIASASPAYTAQTSNRGSLVAGSTTRSPTAHSFRFEWGTTQANGTIGSVGWAADPHAMRNMLPVITYGFPSQSTSSQWGFPWPEHPPLNDYSTSNTSTLRTVAVRQSDGLTLHCAQNTTTVTQFTTSPFTRVVTSTIPTAFSAYGTANVSIFDMCIDSTNLWYCQYGSPYAIKKETLGSLGSTTASYTKPWAGSRPGFIAANSTHLFVTECLASAGTASRTIYKLSQADGSTTTSWTHDISARSGLSTNAAIIGLVWDYTNSLLGVADASGTGASSTSNYATCHRKKITWYDASGNFVYVSGINGADPMFSTGYNYTAESGLGSFPTAIAEYGGNMFIGEAGLLVSGSTSYVARLWQVANLGTRTLLGSPVTKTSSNSLRCVYDFAYS